MPEKIAGQRQPSVLIISSASDEFPSDSLPSVVQKYVVNKSEQLGVPFEFFAGGILAIFAGAIGTAYGIKLNNSWTEPLIMWHVVLAETGSRKTPCFKAVWDIARKKEGEVNEHNKVLEKIFQKQKLKYEAELAQYKGKGGKEPDGPPDPPKKRFLKVSDATYESLGHILSANSCGTSVFRAEILGWIEGSSQYSKNKNGSRTFYLESYDGDSYTMTRVGSGETYIPRNHLNIWGFSQTKNFYRILNKEGNVDDGFAPRFLISSPDPFPVSSSSVADDTNSLKILQSIYSDLVDIKPDYHDNNKSNPITQYLRFNSRTQERWDNWHKKYETVTNKHFVGKNHFFMPWWNKYPGQLARLIGIVHVIRMRCGDTKSSQIDGDSFEMGTALGKHFLGKAFKAVMHGREKTNGNIPFQKEYNKVAKWVKNNKSPMSIRTMTINKCFHNKEGAQKVLELWVDHGLGIFVNEEKNLFVPVGFKE